MLFKKKKKKSQHTPTDSHAEHAVIRQSPLVLTTGQQITNTAGTDTPGHLEGGGGYFATQAANLRSVCHVG